MSAQCEVTAKRATGARLGVFERWLTLWVGLCIVAGITLGHVLPGVFQTIGALEVAQVNLPVAVLIWLMIVPMLVRIDFAALGQVAGHWRGITITVFVNWAVKPFSMAALGWLFIGHWFRPLLPAAQIDSYIAGLILLAAAPCTAMVFVWSSLSKGEPHFTLTQVALNDTIMIFAFAPIVGLLLGLSSITVPWETLILSVVLYIVVPVTGAQILRRRLRICAAITGTTIYRSTDSKSVCHGTVMDDRPRSSPTIGAKATIMMVSFSATWVRVKCGSPFDSDDHTKTMAVQGAAASRISPAI